MDYKYGICEYKHNENDEKTYCQVYVQKFSNENAPILPRGANNRITYSFIHAFCKYMNNNKRLYKMEHICNELNVNYFEFKKQLKKFGRINNGKNLLLFELDCDINEIFEYLESLILLKKMQ